MAEETSTGLSNPLFIITFLGVLVFAIIVDIVDLFLEFIGAAPLNPGGSHSIRTTGAKAFSMIGDAGTSLIIGGWTYWAQKQGVSTRTSGGTKKSVSPQKTAEVGKAGEKITKVGTTGAKEAGKTAAKAGGRFGLRAGLTTGLALLGELIPFVGTAPCWTLTVLGTFINVIRKG